MNFGIYINEYILILVVNFQYSNTKIARVTNLNLKQIVEDLPFISQKI